MRKVLEAAFHQTVFVKEIGQLERTVSVTSPTGAKTIEYEMWVDGDYLCMKLARNGKTAEIMVPSANVIFMLLAPEEPKTQSKPKA